MTTIAKGTTPVDGKALVESTTAISTIFARQLGIFNPHKMPTSVVIVGVGAVGSFVALGLAKLGVNSIEVYDHDVVEDVNLPSQMHQRSGIGKNKAVATKEIIESMMPDVTVYPHAEKWDGQPLKADVVISGADSLKVRKQLWESIKYDPSIKIMADARIGGQAGRFYYIDPDNAADIKIYDGSFPTTEKGMEGSELPCAERGIIDQAFFAAFLHIRNIRRFLVSGKKESYVVFDSTVKFPNII